MINNDSLFSTETKINLNTIDAQTLMATDFRPPVEIIENLLYQGLYILAGSPKVGKSWLCLQIAKGEQVWGRNTLQGNVLYLCLEDSYHRLKSRIGKITNTPSANAHFAIEARDIQNGLDEQIEAFIQSYPDTRIVVIDTFQMVRPIAHLGYAEDYNALKRLRKVWTSIPHSDEMVGKGKNWYAYAEGYIITVNANSFTIITAHMREGQTME